MRLYAAFALGLGIACSGVDPSAPDHADAAQPAHDYAARDGRPASRSGVDDDSGAIGWGAPGPTRVPPREDMRQ